MNQQNHEAMSLEQAIKENTEAVLKLTAIFARYIPAETAAPAAVEADKPAAEEPKPKKSKTAPAPAPAAEPEKPAPAPAPEPEKPAAPAVSLADLQAEGKKLIDSGRQADLKTLVTKLGSTRLSLLPVEKYAEALAELKKLNADDSAM